MHKYIKDYNNSFHSFLDTLEILFQMPKFTMAYNLPMIEYDSALKIDNALINKNYFATIKLNFLPFNLTQKSRQFLQENFHVTLNKETNRYYTLKIKFAIRKKAFMPDIIQYDKLIWNLSLSKKPIIVDPDRIFAENIKQITFEQIIPSELNSVIKQSMEEMYELRKEQKLNHIIFIQRIFSILKNELSTHIKQDKHYQKFCFDFTLFLKDFLENCVFKKAQEIENVLKKDEKFLQINDIEKYNLLITTQECRKIIDFLQFLFLTQKNKIEKISFEDFWRNIFLEIVINLPSFDLDERMKAFFEKYFATDLEKLSKRESKQYSGYAIGINFETRPQQKNQFIFSIKLKEKIGETKIYRDISFIFFNLKATCDVEELLLNIKKKNLDYILQFLTNLKKGNIFEIVNDRFQSNIDYLEALNMYDKIHTFKNFCQGLQYFLKRIFEQNNKQIVKESQNLNDLDNTSLRNLIEELDNEKFEVIF